MPGLYNRATQIINQNQPLTLSDADAGTITFDAKSGISQEDQRDIIKNINQIMQSSKIKAAPELFRIKAQKKGFGFPFVVNLVGLILLAAGVFVLWFIFQREETSIVSGASKGAGGAGKEVIESLKRKAEAELAKKDQEILGVQNNLEKVNSDLNALRENMDSQIADKEKNLRAQFDQNLEEERRKLVATGAAQAEVDKKIRELEAKQKALLEQEMDKAKSDAENERRGQEQALLRQKDQYTEQLDAARTERKRMSDAYELELRKQEENLAEAESKIRSLSAQQEKFNRVNEQIVGFYRLIETDIGGGLYPNAQKRLKDLRDYFNQPAVLAVPEVARRFEVEIFVIESLEELVASAQGRQDSDTQSVQTEAKIVTEIRKLVLQADEAYRAGNKTRADGLYLQALELIPEINKSHDYLMGRVTEIDNFRKTQVTTHLSAASNYYRNKQYPESLASYGKALEYLPTDQNTARILSEIKAAGYEAETARISAEDANRAAARLKAGNELMTKGSLDEAIAVYLDMMKTYPKVPPTAEAAAQLEKAIERKNQEFSRQVTGLQTGKSGDLDAYKKEIETLQKTVAAREKELAALKGTQGDLEKFREEEEKKRLEAEARIKNLETMSADYKKLQSEYATYTRNEASVVRSGALEEMALGKSYLDSFLSAKTVQSAFPGLLERIRRYDRAFEEAGRMSALQDTLEILKAANLLKTKEEKIAFLRKKAAESKKTDPAAVLLKSLIDLISG